MTPNSIIRTTSELPIIIPPPPKGDTKDLKVWKEYWEQHDAVIRQDERKKVLDRFKEVIRLHDEDELLYPDLYNEFLVIYKSLRTPTPEAHR